MDRSQEEAVLRERIGSEYSRGLERLGDGRIRRWVLRRGKEFASPWIWWGDVSKSREESYGGGPHEGVDFALAEMTATGRVEAGLEGSRQRFEPSLYSNSSRQTVNQSGLPDLLRNARFIASGVSSFPSNWLLAWQHCTS